MKLLGYGGETTRLKIEAKRLEGKRLGRHGSIGVKNKGHWGVDGVEAFTVKQALFDHEDFHVKLKTWTREFW